MKYLKYIQYLYLIAGLFFVYDGIIKYQTDSNFPYFSAFLAIMAFVMFFVRRKLANKLNNQNQNQ